MRIMWARICDLKESSSWGEIHEFIAEQGMEFWRTSRKLPPGTTFEELSGHLARVARYTIADKNKLDPVMATWREILEKTNVGR